MWILEVVLATASILLLVLLFFIVAEHMGFIHKHTGE